MNTPRVLKELYLDDFDPETGRGVLRIRRDPEYQLRCTIDSIQDPNNPAGVVDTRPVEPPPEVPAEAPVNSSEEDGDGDGEGDFES